MLKRSYLFNYFTMSNITQFEDLSNELFLEIFEYLHALDLFRAFSSLNNRVASILSDARLHIVISKLHCRHQVEFLSSYLTQHAHQVISVSIQDQLYDFPSIIPFFFNQHTFSNLRSCAFYSICPSAKLDTVFEKLENLSKLVSFRLLQPNDISLSDDVKKKFGQTFMMHRSLKLRSIELLFHYDYPKFAANLAINLTVTSLRMMFYGSTDICLIYKILPILRHYRALRILNISVLNDDNSNTQHAM
jgi:hypothetical protein